MKKLGMFLFSVGILLVSLFIIPSGSFASVFNGHADYTTGAYDYYYFISGGKFPGSTVPNGDNASGGVFRFITDDADWGYATQTWTRDDWFPENAGIAVTLKDNGSIKYDNNGLEDGSYGSYYDDVAAQAAGSENPTAGLYMGYEMSNNFDWIYAGYMDLTDETTFDQIIGYFDGTGYNGGFNPDSPNIRYRMNIWSNEVPDTGTNAGYNMPVNTGSFTGDVFSTDNVSGTFSWSDTGAVRAYSGWTDKETDPIYRIVFTPDEAITLEPGIYWFSHDVAVVPIPPAILLLGSGVLGLIGFGRARFRRED